MTEEEPKPTSAMSSAVADCFAGTAGIAADNLCRAFGEVKAVDGITFTAPAGAVTALIGPNGSGKTTLLLILAGLLKPDHGGACVAGHDVVLDNLSVRSKVGWMPDVFGTWDALTCTEILTTFAEAYGLKPAAGLARAQTLLEQVHLAEYAASPARVLSRGQRQRLGFARALVHDPEILLLDEPASGLDPRSRIELRDQLKDLAQQGKTVLVSSHVLSELEEVFDHAVFLSQGRTVDATADGETSVQRGWRLAALDPVALRAFLDNAEVPWTNGTGGEVVVGLTGRDSAHELVRASIAAGVTLHTIAPVSGRLEEAYLALDEERL